MTKEDQTQEEIVDRKPNIGGVIPGTILICLGILFLLPRLGVNFGNLWPAFVLAPGLAFWIFYLFSPDRKKVAGVLVPGTILVLASIFLYILTVSGWERVSILWPVFPLIVAVAFYALFLTGQEKDKSIIVPANILALMGAVFLVLNFFSFNLWPLILVIVGLLMILRGKKN